MTLYKRIEPVEAIQFHEKDYVKDPEKYPDVVDNVLMSSLWRNKTATDGRYYIFREAPPCGDSITVEENDYIVRDDYDVTYVIPAHVFEMKYRKIEETEND